MSAARLRWEQALTDHAESASARAALDAARHAPLPATPIGALRPAALSADPSLDPEPEAPWPDYDEVI